jgi:exodeoxyribonuclease VII large subunit
MSSDDLFTIADEADKKKKQEPPKERSQEPPKLSNVPEMSVSDLANSLKRTLEETFSHIRVRGELSGIKIAASGHLYGDIKDVDANINIVCWRGTLSKLSVKPEEGMDVIVTGRVSSYAKSSRYQIIIEKMELAGEGALLKLLDERKKKLAAEGLFDSNRKKPLPFLPKRIGVITSSTGAVIRDIMHRLRDRFPSHVLVYPVPVQGQGADQKITSAINGFNQLNPDLRPDLLIIARGGGSLEDLMAFNEENVVRAVAASAIPIISAVGHETDTTLVDYAADLRAPTPTGAAELAVPVRLQIMAQLQDNHERLIKSTSRIVTERKNNLSAFSARLGDPRKILESKAQTVDFLAEKLSNSLRRQLHSKQTALQNTSSKLISPKFLIDQKRQSVSYLNDRLQKTMPQKIIEAKNRLQNLDRMLQSLSHKGVLRRGYALVYDEKENLIRSPQSVKTDDTLQIEFDKGEKLAVKAKKPLKTA